MTLVTKAFLPKTITDSAAAKVTSFDEISRKRLPVSFPAQYASLRKKHLSSRNEGESASQ